MQQLLNKCKKKLEKKEMKNKIYPRLNIPNTNTTRHPVSNPCV